MEYDMKEIIPTKLICSFDDGKFDTALLQYKIRVDGAIDEQKFYTMTVDAGIMVDDIEKILTQSISHVEKGEKIKE
jgi:hypothetical protein